MFGKLFKTITGVLLIPVAIATARAFYLQISNIGSTFSNSLLILERGVLAYVLFHVLIMRPVSIYVFAHEFVHVIATWLSGGRVESFNIGESGGSVVTSKTNLFIELSPYFVPIYTLLLGPIFLVLKAIGTDVVIRNLGSIFLFLVGFTLAFHFVMTTEVLKVKQPDIARSGIIFSIVVIFICNLVITMGVFCPFFKSLSFVAFIKSTASYSAELYVLIYEQVRGIIQVSS